tara:strand:- start:1179 stop:1322 length:144 start_codon:yes stop_codon:yes gene_type:complete
MIMTKSQQVHNLIVKAQWQISKWGKPSNDTALELFEELKLKVEEQGE